MNQLEKNQQRIAFGEWKVKTMQTITPMIVKFFSEKFSMDDAKRLGSIIHDLNNPYFDIFNANGERLDDTTIVAIRILLEIRVEDFIKDFQNKFGGIN